MGNVKQKEFYNYSVKIIRYVRVGDGKVQGYRAKSKLISSFSVARKINVPFWNWETRKYRLCLDKVFQDFDDQFHMEDF